MALRRLLVLLVLLAFPLPAHTTLINDNLVVVGTTNACAATGAVNTYACALDPAITTYTTRGCYSFAANAANTGAATLNLNTLGAKPLKKVQGGITTDLVADDIRTGQLVHVCYDGTNMQLLSPVGNASTGAPGGATGTVQYNAGALGGTTGLTVDGASLLSLQARVTAMATNDTIDPADGPIIACTAGATNKTATLPSAATTTQGWIRLLKVDTGAGACVLAPGGSDTLNGSATTKSATTQWSYVEVWRRSTTDWHAQTGVTSISLTTDVSGVLPQANGGLGWSDTTASGTTHKLVTMGAGTPATDEGAKWDVNGNLVSTGAPYGSGTGGGGVLTAAAERITTVAASKTLDTTDGPIVACTAATDVTLTMPTGTTADSNRHWTIVKVSGAGKCLVTPNGSDTINGSAVAQQAVNLWSRVDLDLLTTTAPRNWSAIVAEDLPTKVLRSLNIPAGSMDVTGGCLQNDPAALLANGPKLPTITCIDDNAASIEFNWVAPPAWDGGTVTVQLHAFNTLAVSTALAMHFAGQCVSSGDPVTAHSTTGEQLATVTWTNATNREVWGVTSTPITLQGSCVAGDHIYIRGQIDGTGANTVVDMTAVKILGVQVRYSNVRALEFAP